MKPLPRLARLLAGEQPDSTPVVPLVGAAAAAMAGTPLHEAFLSAEAQAATLAAYYELVRPDAVFPFMDLTAEPEALGAGITWREGAGPEVGSPLMPDQLERSLGDKALGRGRLPLFRETVARLSDRLGEETVVGAYVPGPWTLVASCLGLAHAARLMRRDPSLAERLIRSAGGYGAELIRAYSRAGAQVVMVLEPCIAGGIVGPGDCTRAILPSLEEMLRHATEVGLPAVLHVCGDANGVLGLLGRMPCAGLSLDAPVDLAAAAAVCGDASLWGNIAPVETLLQGTPETVSAACRECLTGLPAGTPHVLATGCEVPPATPLPHLIEMVRSAGRP